MDEIESVAIHNHEVPGSIPGLATTFLNAPTMNFVGAFFLSKKMLNKDYD